LTAGGAQLFCHRLNETIINHSCKSMKKILTLACALSLWTFNGAIAAEESGPGLIGEYYDLGVSVETFPTISADKKPTIKRVDKTLNFRSTTMTFPDTKLQSHFAIRWTGKIKIPKDGKYTFFLESDDGSRLFIDGKQVVDNGGLHEMQVDSGTVELKAGDHEIKVEYYENDNDGGAGCVLSWKAEGLPKEVVPEKALSH
jgi:hypothetical protein